MNCLLIVGIESVAGSNLAVVARSNYRVVGLSSRGDVQIEGCEVSEWSGRDLSTIDALLKVQRPEWVVFCGAAARSIWDSKKSGAAALEDSLAIEWAEAAAANDARFAMISSDAVFTGPWMLHSEFDMDHFCPTPQAERLRQIESQVREVHGSAVIVRTHVFGWSPCADAAGFAEKFLVERNNGHESIGFLQHSSPILGTDLAVMLLKLFRSQLSGYLHLSGAERINQFQFAERLAEIAEIPAPRQSRRVALTSPVGGYGSGETCLNCWRAVHGLQIRLPMIDEGLGQMLAQQNNGTLDALRAVAGEIVRVA